jgi:hypothetical protein
MTRGNTTNEQSANQPRANLQPSSVRSQLAASPAAKNAGDGQDSAVRPAGGEFDADDLGRVVQTSHAKIVRVIEPETTGDREEPSPAAGAEREPRRLAAADDAIDIMDLPPARSKAQGSQVAQRVASASSMPAEADRYGYAADYRTLRGQLEYSLAERRWKLRYIPIDGDTDSHGGSVVLVDNPPGEFQAGDFVAVAGDLTGDTAVGEFAPKYRASKVAPLAD